MNEGGSIVNISSHLGVVPCTESPAYCSATERKNRSKIK